MKFVHGHFVCGLLLVAAAAAAPATAQPGVEVQPFAYRIRIVRDRRPIEATAVLVRRQPDGERVVLHFVTAAHPFKNVISRPDPYESLSVEVQGRTLDVQPQDLIVPTGLIDIAILRVAVPSIEVGPPALTLEIPPPGSPFLVAGFGATGAPEKAEQRVRRVATLAVAGDRRVAALTGCAGAPALLERRVFGVVSNCEGDTPPVVVPFAAIADWIKRHVPGGLTLPLPMLTEFRLTERDLEGPLLTVACREAQTGDIEVPISVSAGETVIDAKADLLHKSFLRLAEVSILRIHDRSLSLRFTLAGQPPPLVRPPEPCPRGQALVNVRLDLISRLVK
jgi:hypothetical protein